jgi:hypothetical protein
VARGAILRSSILVLATAGCAWRGIYVLFSDFAAARRERKGFCEGFNTISSLELRVSSLRLFLVFVTHFFHLVIDIIEIF